MKQNPSLPNYRAFKRAILVTVIVLILSIICFSAWQAHDEYTLTIHSAELQSRSYARALREHAERAFGEVDGLLLDTIHHIQTHGDPSNETSEHLRKFIKRQRREIPQANAIVLIDRHGKLFAHSLDSPVQSSNAADREFFIHHRDNPQDDASFISKPFKSRLHNSWRFTISRSIRSANGAFAGVVAISFQPEYFKELYRSLELGNGGRILMVRRDGALLLTEPAKNSDLTVDFKKSFLFRQHLPHSPKGTFHIKEGEALLERSGHIISYDSLPGFPVIVTANMDLSEITRTWRQNMYNHIMIATAACAALAFLTLLLLRQIRRIERFHHRQSEQQAEIVTAATAWQTTFDSVADAIWVMDSQRRILRCNKATENLFGKDKDLVIGQLCCSIAHQGTPLPSCPFQMMLDIGQRASLQLSFKERWLDVTVDPMIAEDGTITGAVHIVSDITAIKAAEERYRLLVENLPVVCWQADEQGKTHFISPVATKIEGYTPEEIYAEKALWMERVHPDDRQVVLHAFTSLMNDGTVYDVQYRIKHKSGHWVWLHDFAYTTMLQNGIRVAHGVFSDVTARKQAEDERDQLEIQLRQAQKMEAVGHLAGGIAHDFNNLLTPIMGYTEMAIAAADANGILVSRLNGIMAAAHKAKDLTQQLLGFGRRQPAITQTIDLNEVIVSFNTILHRTIRENIQIELLLDPEGAFIKADRSRIEQIILNLTVNAQDAFQKQGKIIIETCKVLMDGEAARLLPGMTPGEYVLFSFRDNGCGMSSEVMNHIFEPFFTTKQVGHGTGLGLATVYGIVKQHDAHISVTSREGEGTSFRIYFTGCRLCPLPQSEKLPAASCRQSSDLTVLVVEDNEMVRELVCEMLSEHGYRITSAADPRDVLEMLAGGPNVDLLISDVVMPGMNGPELYEQLIVQMPDLKVVYVSGYPVNPGLRGGTVEDEVMYLQKPFTAEALLERIKQVL